MCKSILGEDLYVMLKLPHEYLEYQCQVLGMKIKLMSSYE